MLKFMSRSAILMLAMAFMPIVWADAPTSPGVTTPAEVIPANLTAEAAHVSLDFQDADIRNVLKVLAFKSGVNIVAAPDVTGVVNIELKDVPWQKALDVILSTYGYGFVRKDNIISVMTIENLKKYREDSLALEAQEPLISRTFPLSFAKAQDAMKVIDKLISKRGFINFDDRTNALIIRDLEGNLELITGVIKSIDTITPEVMIETKVIETDLNNTDTLGIDWVMQASVSGSSLPTTFPFSQSKGSGAPGKFAGTTFFPTTTSTLSGIAAPTLASATTTGFSYGTINASSLSATLAALSTHGTTRTLSNPRVVTLDNEKVTFNVGLQYPMPQYSFNSSTGQQQISGYTFTPIGINFEVTPHVNNAGWITLDLHPDISAIDQLVTLQQGSSTSSPVQIPELSDRAIQTKVMVENGKTLVMAGLISDVKTDTKNKVPFLGDIPLLGKLFSSTNKTLVRTELLIFLTPHIITADKNSASAAIQ